MQLRVTEKQMGELLNLIAQGLPYQQLLNELGGIVPSRRQSVVEMLGGASGGQTSPNAIKETESGKQSYQEKVMLSGTEQFIKANEIIGKHLLDQKDQNRFYDKEIARIDDEILTLVKQDNFEVYQEKIQFQFESQLEHIKQLINSSSQKLEYEMTYKIEEVETKFKEFEAFAQKKLSGHSEMLSKRPTDAFMREFVIGEDNKLSNTLKDLIEKEINALQQTVSDISADTSLMKRAIGEQIGQLQKGSDDFTSLIEEERSKNQQMLDELKANIEEKLEVKNQKDELREIKINSFEKKIGALEKNISDQVKLQLKSQAPSDHITTAQFLQLQNYTELMKHQVDQMGHKLESIASQSNHSIEKLHKELDKKAEKDIIQQSQMKFMEKMQKIQSETDETMNKLINDELRKISEQLVNNSKLVDKKIAKLYEDISIDKLVRMIDRKLGKDDAFIKFEGQDQKITQQNKNLNSQASQLNRIQTLVENLAFAIKTLEQSKNSTVQPMNITGLMRQSTMIPSKAQENSSSNQSGPKFARSLTKYQSQVYKNELDPQPPALMNAQSVIDSQNPTDPEFFGDGSPLGKRYEYGQFLDKELKNEISETLNRTPQENSRVNARPMTSQDQFSSKNHNSITSFKRIELMKRDQQQRANHNKSLSGVGFNGQDLAAKSTENFPYGGKHQRHPTDDYTKVNDELKLNLQNTSQRVNSKAPLTKLLQFPPGRDHSSNALILSNISLGKIPSSKPKLSSDQQALYREL